MATSFPDVMADVRSWARGLATPAGGRVFFAWPDTDPAWPAVRLYRVGGGPVLGDVPVAEYRLAFEVEGRPKGATGPGTYADVCATVAALEAALHDLRGPIGAGGTYVLSAEATNGIDSPDPATGASRQIVDAVLTVRHA